MKKIVYLHYYTHASGGVERVLANKVNWWVRHGYDVTIVTTDQRGRAPFYDMDAALKRVDLGVNLEDAIWQQGFLRREIAKRRKAKLFERELGKWLADNPADVVFSMFGPTHGWLKKLKDGSRKVAEFHISQYALVKGSNPLKKMLQLGRAKRAAAQFDRFVVLSHEDAADWGGLSNLRVIPNATSFEPVGGAALESKRVIAVGRLNPQKRFDKLIEAWAMVHERHPDWRLDIYGGGDLLEALEEQIIKAGLQDVAAVNQPTSEIRERLQESSIYAMSSDFEGLPMVLVEAMSQGVPCVATTCKCGPSDIITPEKDGLLVPVGNTPALADGICRLIENPDLRRRMGAAAVQTVKDRFTEEAVMEQWVKLIEEL